MEFYEIKKILVPNDFSEEASNSLQTAIAICKKQLATLTIIYVIENTTILLPDARATGNILLSELIKNANEKINQLTREVRVEHNLVVNHIIKLGYPADEICRWASEHEMDLIVMGTHGASGLREFFIGSTAYRVVKHAPCPVLTIPGTGVWLDFKRVLFPIRLVPHALDKYDVVRPIIRKNNASLLISGIVQKTDPAGLEVMKVLTDSVAKRIAEDDMACSVGVHYCKNITKQVLAISEAESPDLIVITAALDESLSEFFLSSYTQNIVNHAKFPVLSIRPEMTTDSASLLSNPVIF